MLVILPIVVLVTLLPSVAPSPPPWQHCGSSGNYTAGSKYEANLQLLSTTLPLNASSSPKLFAKAAAGTGPDDQVFALALCRGDTNASSCLDCEMRAFRNAQSLCPYSKEAAIYDDLCLAFFSGADFLASTANLGQVRLYVNRNSPTNVASSEFVTLVRALLSYSMQWAVYNSTGMMWYSTVRMGVVTPPLYSVMQCTPDMLGAECWQCLQDLVNNSSFNGSTAGVRSFGARCGYRYETYQFYSGRTMLNIGSLSQIDSTAPPSRPPPPPLDMSGDERSGKNMNSKVLIVAILLPLFAASSLLILSFVLIRRVRKNKSKLQKKDSATREEILKLWRIEESDSDFMLLDFNQIKEATRDFSETNKLGEGGFGSVYKGQLPNGLEVAVKRLAAHSSQGLVEFKNEIQLIAKLQHTNLVNLRGCCVEGEENILMYEYMKNKSLDSFIFDVKRAALLNWNRRLSIIEGITQGLLYLHRHSRLRIIHRDLKASNILLDDEMNPKISDFGLAKIFDSKDIQGNTKRVVGTYGYMAPEYASEGCFSVKSDVFSYGVLVLEIISEKRNAGFHQCGDFFNLLGYAWHLWKDENWIELVAPLLVNEGKMMEIKKCIKIALLCVQENAADRPTMSDVVIMLSSQLQALPEPKQPAFFNVRAKFGEMTSFTARSSGNDLTITCVTGR